MYENGFGVEQDYKEAIKWYRKSADQGYRWGQLSLGTMYQRGYGVPKDISMAKYWYQKAADQGMEEAIEALKRLN